MTLGTGTESALIIDIAFWVIAVSSIVSAFAVVQLRDLFRAALFLAVSFLGVAGIFVLMRAEFLAIVQVLIYVGAISVLVLFAILMTRDIEQGNPPNRLRVPAAILALLIFLATSVMALNTNWNIVDDQIPQTAGSQISTEFGGGNLPSLTVDQIEKVYSNTVPQIASLLLRDYVLAFEIASVLLLAAVIGALALIRER